MKRQAVCALGALCLASTLAVATPGGEPDGSGASLAPATGQESGDKTTTRPALEALKRRLADKDVTLGTPIMIRIFKQEDDLEVWVQKAGRFELLATYNICNWSGKLGPKLTEGDRQSPEGLYSIGTPQLHRTGRWPRSLDIGYPNTYDKAHGRNGSFILVHGGCTTIGCFAMTDPIMEEVFTLSEAALAHGQDRIQVHVFPFRMTQQNMERHAQSQWAGFWANLKTAYDAFEETRVPPQVRVCGNRYEIGGVGADDHCVDNVSEASVLSPAVINAARIARLRKIRRARIAQRAARARHARRAQRARHAGRVNRGGRMALGGPKVRRR
jgi:murein L,D-transpeptidase YafK